MALYDRDDRMSRREFLVKYGLDAATEKRARAERLPWPPHKLLGGRVFYSKTVVTNWFAHRDQPIEADRKQHVLHCPAVDVEVAR